MSEEATPAPTAPATASAASVAASAPRPAPVLMRCYKWLMRRLPIVSGLTRLSFNRVTNRHFPRLAHPVTATLTNGIRIDVDPNDYHGRVLYLFGSNDPKVQHAARALLRPGDRFLDIGANYCSIGLQVADVVGPTGRVHLFEPQPHLCDRVERALAGTGLDQVELHRVALMGHDGQMELTYPSHHSGRATLVGSPERDRSQWLTQTVPVRAIDRYVSPLVGDEPFGVKLDVEGAEPMLLPWILARPGLRFIILEAADHRQELWELIGQTKLTLYGLCRLPLRRRVRRIDRFEQIQWYHDLLALHVPQGLEPPDEINPTKLGRLLRDAELRGERTPKGRALS